MEIKISIIVAVYNRMNYLKNMLLALERQKLKNFEVVIADDGSKENIEDYKELINNLSYKVRHVYQEDDGFRLSASRNNGIRNARGEFLLFLDQDVLMDENFISEVTENIRENKILKINALYLDKERSEIIEKNISKNNNFDYEYVEEILEKKDFKEIRSKDYRAIRRNILYALKLNRRGAKIIGLGIGGYKKDFLKINGFDERYEGWGYEDDDVGNRFYALGLGVKNIKFSKPVVHMWHRDNSSKAHSPNESYYYKRKKEIFKTKDYRCIYGVENKLKDEEITVKELN
ncbi:glycosyltransferase [Fusobacterium sp. MFO224]|uniref:glycosyltransferase n=1 Tax=Fusobacterium sp. MFO224 TaxID=3378070 RepID=UPI003852CC52